MLRLMMDHHPEIACLGEFEEAVSQAGDEGWPDIDWYRAWLSQDRAFAAKRLDVDQRIDSYPALVKSLWSQFASRTDKPIRGICVHSRFDRLRDIWPNIRLVFLVRDPRDVASSCVKMGWVGEPTHGADYWLRSTRRWLSLRDSLHTDNFIELKYEVLMSDLDGQLDRCCRLLGRRFDPRMLEYHRHSTYGVPDPSLVERWRTTLTPRQVELIDVQCTSPMVEYEYTPIQPSPRPPSPAERLLLKYRHRVGRLRWQIRRYGLPLAIAWIVTSRFSIHSAIRRTVATRVNAARASLLK